MEWHEERKKWRELMEEEETGDVGVIGVMQQRLRERFGEIELED